MQSLLQKITNKFQFNWHGDRTLLLICMGISLFFWIVVKMSDKYVAFCPVYLTFQVKEGYALQRIPDTDFDIKIQGSGWDLMKQYIFQHEIKLTYHIASERPVMTGGELLRSDISKQFGRRKINILSLPFEPVYLQAEEKVEKLIPVRFTTNITCAPGFQLKQPAYITPDSILIAGAKSNIDPITYWDTDSLVLADIETSQKVSLPLHHSQPELELKTTAVEVTIDVEQFTQKSFFVPVQIVNQPATADSLILFPKQVKVDCVVGFSAYKALKSTDFVLEADLKNVTVNEDKNTAPLLLTKAPKHVRNISFIPEAVSFYFIKRDSSQLEQIVDSTQK